MSKEKENISKSNKKACPERRRRVYVGMSGGVDSSVAAYLLKEQNYDVVGVYLLCFSGPAKEQSSHGASDEEVCSAKKDMEDARAVAFKLGIPFYVWNLEKEYKEKVIDYMVEGYRSGITPNPDVMCNREIKFGIFLSRALAMGADFVATGHYVRLQRTTIDNKQFTIDQEIKSSQLSAVSCQLFSARDAQKDQSYFLWTLAQDQLKHCLFPIGDYLKSDVREIARGAGLITADKKDSQGVCFVGKIKLGEFLSSAISSRRGEILTASGEKIGEHNGAEFYTIGQRHLGVSNMEYGNMNKGKDTKPHYVVSKDIKNNVVTVVDGADAPELFRNEVHLSNVNFISPNQIPNFTFSAQSRSASGGQIPVLARVRYRQPLSKAVLTKGEGDKYKLAFDTPQKFVAEGQSSVFYSEKGEMLGGGVIL